jgi:hypothetical protein
MLSIVKIHFESNGKENHHAFRDGGIESIDIEVSIWTMPQEIDNPIYFDQDDRYAAYDCP